MPDFLDHSDEMQQMMGRIPGWLIRWGLWIICVIFCGILVGCYLIKYPQTITGPIQLTAYNPPVELLAPRSGRIAQLFVAEGDSIKKDECILVLESTADYNDIISVDSLLTMNTPWKELVFNEQFYQEYSLGDIQSYFLQFQHECAAFREYLSSSLNRNKEELSKRQIDKQKELLNFQRKQLSLSINDFELARKDFIRDSILFSIDGIAQANYEKARQILLQKEAAVIGYRTAIGNSEASLLLLHGNLLEIQSQNETQIKKYCIEIDRLKRQLSTQISEWRKNYLITAPLAGKVFLSNIWSENQNVMTSERVATIIPRDSALVIGRMAVSFAGYSKIQIGQMVNVRLDNYPYMEFGIIRAEVHSVSPIPDKEGYVIEIKFCNGLITSYGIPVRYVYKMTGIADIITKDMRLIDQFLQPLKMLFHRI